MNKKTVILVVHAIVLAALFVVEVPVQQAYYRFHRATQKYAVVASYDCRGEQGMQARIAVTTNGAARIDRSFDVPSGSRLYYQLAEKRKRTAVGSFFMRVVENDFWAFFEQLGLIWWGVMVCIVIWVYDPARRRYVLLFFLGAIATAIVVTVCKETSAKVRPEPFFSGEYPQRFVGFLKGWTTSAPTCFPSGHTTHVFLTATFIALLYPRIAWLLYFAAFATGASRVVTEAHWFSDVYAGALLGHYAMRAMHAAFDRHVPGVLARLPKFLKNVLRV